jgi:hypothetical protein
MRGGLDDHGGQGYAAVWLDGKACADESLDMSVAQLWRVRRPAIISTVQLGMNFLQVCDDYRIGNE